MKYIVCRVCLKRGDDLIPMKTKDTELYYRLLNELPKQMEILICIYCSNLLHKLQKFISQCHKAKMFLDQMMNQETIPLHLNYNNLSISPMKTYYVGPDYVHLDLDLKEDGSVFDCNEAYITEDEDEIPLVLFSNGLPADVEDVAVKKEDQEDNNVKEDILNTEPDVKLEDGTVGNKKRKKQKKVLREGFTSRMVQETPEYTVIKLTKEQVLEEMAERSKCEKYLRAPYKCEKCVKGFNFEDVLQTHMEKHSPERGPLSCELCGQRCPGAVSLRGHTKSHVTRYSCKVCGYARRSRQHVLEHHAAQHAHAPAAYRCSRCDYTTSKRTVMQRHVRATHAAAEPHACHKCGKLYKSIDSLRVHAVRHDSKQRYQCDQCNLCFAYPTLLRKHERSVHSHRDYYCVECDIKFKSMDTLKLHFKRAKRHRDSSYKSETQPNRKNIHESTPR